MDTITEVNARFKLAVNKVIDDGLAKNKTAIAEAMQISKSKFSEILNDRMNVGIDLLVNFCLYYKVNANWLLFERGEIINDYINDDQLMRVAEPDINEFNKLKKEFEDLQKKMQQFSKKLRN